MSEEELKALKKFYDQLSTLKQKEKAGLQHSIDEIDECDLGAKTNKTGNNNNYCTKAVP